MYGGTTCAPKRRRFMWVLSPSARELRVRVGCSLPLSLSRILDRACSLPLFPPVLIPTRIERAAPPLSVPCLPLLTTPNEIVGFPQPKPSPSVCPWAGGSGARGASEREQGKRRVEHVPRSSNPSPSLPSSPLKSPSDLRSIHRLWRWPDEVVGSSLHSSSWYRDQD